MPALPLRRSVPWPRVPVAALALLAALAAPDAASAASVKISAPIPAGYELSQFALTPDGATVVYVLGKAQTAYDVRLVAVPATGGMATPLVDVPLTATQRSIDTWRIAPDGQGVLFTSDKDNAQFSEDLFYVPIDGSSAPVKLNGAPAPANVSSPQLSPDGTRVVFETTGTNKLFSVPITGGTPVELATVTGSFLPRFRIAPDGGRVIYAFDDTMLGLGVQLYSIPIAGGAATRLTSQPGVSFPTTGSITPDSATVLYFAANGQEIWKTPIASLAPTRLAGPVALYTPDYRLTPDGTTVTFVAGAFPDYVLSRVPVDGSTAAEPLATDKIGVSELQMSANGTFIVYRVSAMSAAGLKFRVFSVRVDGTGDPVELTPAVLTGFGAYNVYRIDPASARVVYGAEQDAPGVTEIYSVPIGGGPTVKLNKTPMPASADVILGSVAFSPDGLTVLYVADQDADGVQELFSTGAAGGATTKVHPDLAPDKDVLAGIGTFPSFTGDSLHIVYAADQETDGVFELFTTDDPDPSPTSTTGGGPTPTATPGARTATPTPVATRTPSPETGDACADCIDNDFDGAVDRADATCPATADGGGLGLASPAGKAALKCQKAIGKHGTTFALKRVKTLGECLQKAIGCVQNGGEAACLAKAEAACGKADTARQTAVAKLSAALGKACAVPPLGPGDLDGLSGLAFAAEAPGCDDFGVPSTADAASVAACVAARHACRADALVGTAIPRARTLLAATGRDPAADAPCLPPGGTGGAAADPKAVLTCQKAFAKAALAYASARLKGAQKCAEGVLGCVQTKAADPKCRPKADAACVKLAGKTAAAAIKVGTTVRKACGGVLADLLDAAGVGFALRADECRALGGAPDSVDGIANCVVTQHACRVDQLIVGQTPRAVEAGALGP